MSFPLVYVLPVALAAAALQPLCILAYKSERIARLKGRLRGRRAVLPPERAWSQFTAPVNSVAQAEALVDRLDREIRARSYAPARELARIELLIEALRLHLDMLAIEERRTQELDELRAQEVLRAWEAAQTQRMREALEAQARQARADAQEQSRRRAEAAAARAATGWRRVLNLDADESRPEIIKRAYRSLAQRHHPDKGGSVRAMAELNTAYATARKELDFR